MTFLTQECSNDDLELTLRFLWQGQICFLGFHMGRVRGFCRGFWCKNLIKTVEHKNIFLALAVKIIV